MQRIFKRPFGRMSAWQEALAATVAQVEALGLDSAIALELTSAAQGNEHIAEELLGALLTGCEVQLVELSNAALNGCTGVVADAPRQGERIPVLLHNQTLKTPTDWYGGNWTASTSPKPLAVRPRNLRVLAPPTSEVVISPMYQIGGEGSLPGQFRAPRNVTALANGMIAVAEYAGNARVQLLTKHGEPLRVIDGRFQTGVAEGPHTRNRMTYRPTAIALGSEDTLLLVGHRDQTDWDNPAAEQYPSIAGHFANLLRLHLDEKRLDLACGGDPDDKMGHETRAVVYDPVSDVVYTCSAGRPEAAKLIGLPDEYTMVCYSYASQWDAQAFEIPSRCPETSAVVLHTPVALAIHGDELYVCDQGLDCISIFMRAGPQRRFGAFARSIGSPGERAGQLTEPQGIACDGAGRLFVSEKRRLQVFDCCTGEPLQALNFDGASCLSGISVAGAHLLVADQGLHVVHALAIGGVATAQLQQRAREALAQHMVSKEQGVAV
jgi:hypothetical protein